MTLATRDDRGPQVYNDHGTNPRQIAALTAESFTNLEAIRAATTNAATLIGWTDRAGSLEVGKFADVIAVSGNPLLDLRQLKSVLFVMKGDIVVKN